MLEDKRTTSRKRRLILYTLVIFPIITITIVGLWSLNINNVPLVRDLAIDYIKRYHPETVDLLIHLTWSGGRDEIGESMGYELYVYTSSGWIIEITFPVVSNPAYIIKADYSSSRTENPEMALRIIWEGSYINDKITENIYSIAQ
jgi:hypothetical protein